MTVLLTIIIPTYNMEKYLRRCLDSLIISDIDLFSQLEVLVVNDGSKDSSSSIAHEYQDKFPGVFRLIDKENGNYGSCVNRGLQEAKGKYVKILDADDSFDTANFEIFLLFLQNTDVDCVLSDMIQVDESGRVLRRCGFNLPGEECFSLSRFYEKQHLNNLWMHNVCYKTENLRLINYRQSEGISYTDQEWIYLPMSSCNQLSYWPHVVYRYLVGRDGQTIDTSVFEKNFWMEIKGTQAMICERNEFQKEAIDHRFLDERLRYRINTIYVAYFGRFKTANNNGIVRDFDLYLKSQDYHLWDEWSDKYLFRSFPYKFVKHWRKHYDSGRISIKIPRLIVQKILSIRR